MKNPESRFIDVSILPPHDLFASLAKANMLHMLGEEKDLCFLSFLDII